MKFIKQLHQIYAVAQKWREGHQITTLSDSGKVILLEDKSLSNGAVQRGLYIYAIHPNIPVAASSQGDIRAREMSVFEKMYVCILYICMYLYLYLYSYLCL